MPNLRSYRAEKPVSYPDQAVYAEYACATFALTFQDIDSGSGHLFSVSSPSHSVVFGSGRCSYFPQNNATANSLATDKYFANTILARDGVPTLGGHYFFLHDRHRASRPQGHERSDAINYFESLGASAFVKPLTGSHGDFAQAVNGEADLLRYLDEVSRYYDSVLLQPVFAGKEYRIFVLDGEIVYSARKYPPGVIGDGIHSIRELLAIREANLSARGVSSISMDRVPNLDMILPKSEIWEISGRMNRSAGGAMRFESPQAESAAFALARKASKTLGLRAAAIDLFTDIGDDPEAIRLIEVNANPSIRFLEDSDRGDLILKIWHHTFSATGLLVV